MNKKGVEWLNETIIFILLNIVFFAGILLFIWIKSSGAVIYEEVYAKQIALFIDEAKPGTEIILPVSELAEQARKNKFSGEIININPETSEVTVKVHEGSSYSYAYFSENVVAWGYKPEEENLYLEIS